VSPTATTTIESSFDEEITTFAPTPTESTWFQIIFYKHRNWNIFQSEFLVF